MRKVTALLISVLTLLSTVFRVFAYYHYWRVNVLVAYDEEWQWKSNWYYGYSAEEFASVILSEVNDLFYSKFNVWFWPVDFVIWDSDDAAADDDVMMDEVISETGFNTGMQIGAYVVDVLIVFTDQDIPGSYGYSDRQKGVVLVWETYKAGVGQCTDNVLQHELSHLYHAEDHNVEGLDCVMNYALYWIGGIYQYWVRTALVTNNWCPNCTDIIHDHLQNWGENIMCLGGGNGRMCMIAW